MIKQNKKDIQIHPNNKLNDLSGDRWMYLTQSVIKTNYKKEIGFELRKIHGANKPPQLMKQLIEFFSKKGELVLDPFAGVGGTLIGATLCGRKAIGIEINKKWFSIYKKVCISEGLTEQDLIVGDCIEVINNYNNEWKNKMNLILTDPPYNVRLNKTMCNNKYPNKNRSTNFEYFSNIKNDFSNSKDFNQYLMRMKKFLSLSYNILKPLCYLILILRNSYQNGEYIMTSSIVSDYAKNIGYKIKGEIIWYSNGNRLRPYGYPFVFVPNIIHHNILIFRKETY